MQFSGVYFSSRARRRRPVLLLLLFSLLLLVAILPAAAEGQTNYVDDAERDRCRRLQRSRCAV